MYVFMSFSFHFSFFVLVDEVTKIRKYYIIMLVCFFTEQGKTGKVNNKKINKLYVIFS